MQAVCAKVFRDAVFPAASLNTFLGSSMQAVWPKVFRDAVFPTAYLNTCLGQMAKLFRVGVAYFEP